MFGSLGSLSMLDKIISFLNISNEDEKYLLITGNNYYEYTKEKLKQKNNVLIERFVDRDFLYKNSKLVFIRGGASTLMEVMYFSIVISAFNIKGYTSASSDNFPYLSVYSAISAFI